MSDNLNSVEENRLRDEIAERLVNNEEVALDMVLHHIVPIVLPSLCRGLGYDFNDPTVEDIISMALFRLWQSRSRFDPKKGSIGAWFYVIARNVAIDLKRLEKRPEPLEFLPRFTAIPRSDAASDPARQRAVLEKVLDKLTNRQRRVIEVELLGDDAPVSMSELADELGLSPGALRALRFRAMQKFRRALDEQGYDLADANKERR
jgi:RNA polymerase sigma factor (sigma-70 family)